MRRAHTVEQVRTAEAAALAVLPDGALMQRAAHGLAYAVLDLLGSAYGRRVLLLVGAGDNGGDALYAGAVLARRGARVEALLLSEHAHPGGLAALRAAGGRVVAAVGTPPEVVVDGIVGIGGRPGLRPEAVAALAAVADVPVVAVDLPSGVDVDTGELAGPHVRAAVTVTFGTLKVAHLVDPAASACGAVHLVDLDLPLPAAPVEALQAPDVARLLPRPASDAQKYTRGVVGVRAGSPRYPGAALLSVAGASSGLCGMVRYAGDPGVGDRVRAAHPEVVGPGRVQAWVVGSGTDDRAAGELAAALADGVPLVVDADALAHVARPLPPTTVLTPHAGELSAMLGAERAAVEAAPLAHARQAADSYGCVVLLKGRHTLVAEPAGRVRVTTTGVPWLATAGAGDVLGGLIGALLAAGLDAFDAASVGSWLHGAAATLASAGGPLVAGQVAAAIPDAVRALPLG
ncbi:bifunctional ADP-dependent NAD(P)H-hydrate dehydratase/NAD(P)H-hydrate epimerase [Nocardioides pantholopis]|uniref:bifunctional ADP-dependent NAD(P)H-hydrate dehydratase/NAD(P)H-hydrate epimerase n=1 Tax=Nocardioides pantholopis TaxID=2483798 RepID=UPI000FD6D71F|nr:bifunctional ADP-dependent NAD(P)H-hydrate dehydratase/NAD(P)H-hydrate epimerase [Nocardioides pantholopis]